MNSSSSIIFFCILAIAATVSNAFTVVSSVNQVSQRNGVSLSPSTTQLHIFGNALKGAFSNDDSLGQAKSAGLSNVSNVILIKLFIILCMVYSYQLPITNYQLL